MLKSCESAIPPPPTPPVSQLGSLKAERQPTETLPFQAPLKQELQHKLMVGEVNQQQRNPIPFKKNPYAKTVLPVQDVIRKVETLRSQNGIR